MDKPCFFSSKIKECNLDDCFYTRMTWDRCGHGKLKANALKATDKAKLAKARKIQGGIWAIINEYMLLYDTTSVKALKAQLTKEIKKHL
jgi:hypothetical protein